MDEIKSHDLGLTFNVPLNSLYDSLMTINDFFLTLHYKLTLLI